MLAKLARRTLRTSAVAAASNSARVFSASQDWPQRPITANTTTSASAANNQHAKPLVWQAIEKRVGPKKLERILCHLGGNANEVKPTTGETAIELAIKQGSHPSIIRLLLHACANRINKRLDRNGSSLLHLAAEKCTDPRVIQLLMRAGLKPSQRNSSLETPLHVAARANSNPQIIEALLKKDSDGELVHLIDEHGLCPLDASVNSNRNPDVNNVLVQHGGDYGLCNYDWSPIFPQSRFKWGISL